jgi:hypothetical protein
MRRKRIRLYSSVTRFCKETAAARHSGRQEMRRKRIRCTAQSRSSQRTQAQKQQQQSTVAGIVGEEKDGLPRLRKTRSGCTVCLRSCRMLGASSGHCSQQRHAQLPQLQSQHATCICVQVSPGLSTTNNQPKPHLQWCAAAGPHVLAGECKRTQHATRISKALSLPSD